MAVQDGKRWGQWRYDKSTLTLDYIDPDPRKNGEIEYCVELERCGTANDILDWVLQLTEKAWMPPKGIGDFVMALDELAGWGLQGKVIGVGQSFGWKAHLVG